MMKALLGVVMFATSTPQGSPADLLQAVRLVVADVAGWTANAFEAYREDEPGRTQGPFFVDVGSLVTAAKEGTGTVLDSRAAGTAIGRPFRTATRKEAVRSAPAPDTSYTDNYWIKDDGVHVQFDSVARTPQGYDIVVTYRLTERRPTHEYRTFVASGVGFSTVRYSLAKRDAKWVIAEREVLSTS